MIAPIKKPVLLFAGGGTGGHVYPALALARALPMFEVLFVVPRGRGDAERIRGEFETIEMDLPRIDRERLRFPARFLRSVVKARRLLRSRDVAAVAGMGGYSAVPVCIAAKTLRKPFYLVELNAVAGKATRALARLASGVGLGDAAPLSTFQRHAPCRVTGTPLRMEAHLPASHDRFGLRSDSPTLLVLGGSQGSRGLNTRMLDAMRACEDLPFQVLHCTGSVDAERVRAAYRPLARHAVVLDHLDGIGSAYSVADVVIARAGASTVAECLARGKPTVFVPYPHHRDQQQHKNAESAVAAEAARLVREEELTPSAFRRVVAPLLVDVAARESMAHRAQALARPAAAEDMAGHLLETLGPALSERSWVAELGG